MSHIVCEKCNGHQAHCTKCNKPWSLDLGSKHRCHFNGRATHARYRRGCDGRHRDFKCDRCGLITEGRPPVRGSKFALLPQGWGRATTPGANFSNLDLCGSCYPRFAIAHDAAAGGEDASRLDEAINRVESIACGWAFDLGGGEVRGIHVSFSRAAGGFPIPSDFAQEVRRLISVDGTAVRGDARSIAFGGTTPSQEIEQEDGEYNREEYR